MARRLHRHQLPAVAASAINQSAVVTLSAASDTTGVAANTWVQAAATVNQFPLGVALATAASPLFPVTVIDGLNIAAVPIGASVGIGADVGVASTNGAIGPVTGASGSLVWSLGKTLSNGVAGETVSVYINPQALSGRV